MGNLDFIGGCIQWSRLRRIQHGSTSAEGDGLLEVTPKIRLVASIPGRFLWWYFSELCQGHLVSRFQYQY